MTITVSTVSTLRGCVPIWKFSEPARATPRQRRKTSIASLTSKQVMRRHTARTGAMKMNIRIYPETSFICFYPSFYKNPAVPGIPDRLADAVNGKENCGYYDKKPAGSIGFQKPEKYRHPCTCEGQKHRSGR